MPETVEQQELEVTLGCILVRSTGIKILKNQTIQLHRHHHPPSIKFQRVAMSQAFLGGSSG